MAAPCMNDTCSITTSIDAITRQLSINVNRRNQAGLYCDGGLGVKVFGDPVNAMPIDTCFQQLGIAANTGDSDGLGALVGLWSIPKRAKFKTFNSDAVNIKQGAGVNGEGAVSVDPLGGIDITNPYDCQAMMLVMGRFMVGYTVSYTDSVDNLTVSNPVIRSDTDVNATNNQPGDFYVPFNADIKCALAINASNEAVSFMDIGGIVPVSHVSGLNNSNKRRWEYFAFRYSIAAGATVTLSASSNHEGSGESVNVKTIDADVGFPDRGFSVDGTAIIFPFNNEAL